MSDALAARTMLLLLVFGGRAMAQGTDPCGTCARACAMVKEYGRNADATLDLESVIELNMQGWKPQSRYGIEIFGWAGARGADQRCVVSYSYRDGELVSLTWQVDLESRTVTPTSPLSERMQRMTDVLSVGSTVAQRTPRDKESR